MEPIKQSLICLLSVLSCLWITSPCEAQRYLEPIFSDVQVEYDQEYGVNATILTFPSEGEATPVSLLADIYQPMNDTLAERPLLLILHDGNFLPVVINGQITGSKKDSAVVELCTQFARRGYTVAAISYRLGWNPLANTQVERALFLIQAIYRGMQDGRTAIRFFRKTYAEDGNPYQIDTSRISVLGIGSGGYISLAMAGLDDYHELLTTTHPAGKFIADLDGDGIPELPMVDPIYHADIEGKELVVVPDSNFGFPAGDTSNYPNHPNYTSNFHFCLNLSGGLCDLSWFDDLEMPTITVQSALDYFVPYEDYPLYAGDPGLPIFRVQGGRLIGEKQINNGNNQLFEVLAGLDSASQLAKMNSDSAGHPYFEGLFPFYNPVNVNEVDEGLAIDWWDSLAPSPINSPGMGVPWNELPHPLGGTYHDYGLFFNEGMSAAKARANIQLIVQYIAPRACLALDLQPCASTLTPIRNPAPGLQLEAFPNPASNQLNVYVADQKTRVSIYTTQGQQVWKADMQAGQTRTIPVRNMATGLYILVAKTNNGMVVEKIVVE